MGRGAVPYSLQILGGGGARLHAEDDRKIGGEVLGLVHQAGLRGRGGGYGERPPNRAVRTGPGVARLTCSMLPKHSSEPCWHWNCHFPETFLSCGTKRCERGWQCALSRGLQLLLPERCHTAPE